MRTLKDIPPLDPEITNLPEHLEIINPKPKRTWWQFPNDDDEGRHVKKRRHSTTREEKLEALSFLKNARTWQINKAGYAELKPLSVRYAAEILGFHESQPRDWKSHEQKIRDAPKNSKKCGVGAPPAWPEMEVRLAAECGEKYRAGYEVNRDWFYRHAKKIYEEEYPNEVEVKDGVKSYLCEFSNGWFQGFKKRHGLSCRDPKGIPAEADEFTVQSSDEDV
ncbi:Similar to hypothetical protein NECHADRAFT_81850 [Nectria haematococca mpVI 77-13-4]; acc. no. XP_003044862 [Pyronema omphalodes CBS 100304]|uniref:HTH CENPB-type domain-containing protein n=1 Tax=Pyronema omphalodes (strain CBS 100304) TaxID=1076935 RepID=U4KW77_PYROM|nr:Similar to hypothetical protein NECHADRAFT_81850 [Nectria haematococca mpVI 77-13-4]; acc. no. XP_003044862 [Pyronema omphalodes CBS 100304]